MLVVLALRNLARHRRRTLLSLTIVAAGTAGIVLTAGFVRFSFQGLREAIVHGGLGHLEITPPASPEASTAAGPTATAVPDRTAAPALADWERLRESVEHVPHVLAAAAIVQLSAMATHGERTAAVFVLGVEPDRERRMRFDLRLRDGEDVPAAVPPEGEDAAVLGVGLARALRARPGDTVTLLAMTPDGTLDALDVSVRGIFTTGLEDLDARVVRIHLASAQRLLATESASSVIVGLDDTGRTAETKRAVESLLGSGAPGAVVVADWESRAPFYRQVRALYTGVFRFFGVVVVVLVCLATSNTIWMSVLERVRELGTLRAIGTSRAQVAALVLSEALWMGLLGAAAGCALAAVLTAVINGLRIQMPPPPGAADAIDLQLAPAPVDFAGAAALMALVLVAAAALPAWSTVRLRIVDALGHV